MFELLLWALGTVLSNEDFWDSVGDAAENVMEFVTETAESACDSVGDLFEGIGESIGGCIESISENMNEDEASGFAQEAISFCGNDKDIKLESLERDAERYTKYMNADIEKGWDTTRNKNLLLRANKAIDKYVSNKPR